jgi:P27 family predicted phage terminase small subunit
MAGRKRIPTHMHIVKGTAQPCRMNPREPDPSDEIPRAPKELSPRACEIFGTITARLEAIGIASSTFTENQALLASTLEEMEILNIQIEQQGRSYSTVQLIEVPNEEGKMVTKAQKIWKSNPLVAQRNTARRQAQSLLSDFGLTPSSLGKVSGKSKNKEISNRWEAFK